MIERELIELHANPREVPAFSEGHPGLTPEAGYAAARALHEHRIAHGWRAVGRKIGFTNRTLWPRYGVYEPIWGTVYDRTLAPAQGNAATVRLAGLVQPRIEPEICFGLRSPPPPGADPAGLLECIDWVAHSIEIVQCHHAGWKMKLPDCTAGNGLHGRLVVGERVRAADLPHLIDALPALEVILKNEGKIIDRGRGANVLDGPLHALAYFIAVLEKQRDAPPLAAGELVTTGTITDAHPVAPGDSWSTEIRGLALPGLRIEFE